MSFQSLLQASKKYFPNLQIKYKNQSLFFRLLGKVLFFNKSFMNSYTTTVGSTMYFPSETFVKIRPISGSIIFLHELVHIYDAYKLSIPVFSFLYLFPQILALLAIPLFILSWKLSLVFLLFLLPLPSYFRMRLEKRAYLTSLYSIYKLSKKLNFDHTLNLHKKYFLTQFKGPYYYFMWSFGDLDKEFSDAIAIIIKGGRPFESPIFDMLDELIRQV